MRWSAQRTAITAACFALWLSPAWAQDEEAQPAPDIACPVTALSSRDTTEIPPEWERPARKGNLGRTTVENRGGNSTLICSYGAAGNLTQAMPETYESCSPVEGGFKCQRRARQNPFISRGEVTLTPGRGVDLDRGNLVDDVRESDLAFAGFTGYVGTGSPSAILESFNETRFGPAPRNSNNPRDCIRADMRTTRMTVGADVRRGESTCYRTNDGRIGMMTIVGVEGFTVQFRHRTFR
jgi:hypothetical protein